jgi:hypothetical protein
MKPLIAATLGLCLIASSVALADARRPHSPAAAAAVRISDIDADLLRSGRLRLESETRNATRLTFTYRGQRYAGRAAGTDEGKRKWARTVRTRGGDRAGSRVTIRVRACAGSHCVTRSSVERLEAPGGDSDD